MPVEASHVQLLEYEKEVIPYVNWMMEDLFCRYGVSIPYFILDFSFPDYSARPDWVSPYIPELPEFYIPSITCAWPQWLPTNGFNFGSDWGKWEYNLPWFNELLGLAFDEAGLPRWQMPDFENIAMLNERLSILYQEVEQEYEFESQTKDGYLSKYTTVLAPPSWQVAWDSMEADTPAVNTTGTIIHVYFEWDYISTGIQKWAAGKSHGYLSFDTSSLSGKTISAATLKCYFSFNHLRGDIYPLEEVETDQTLQVYNEDWGTLDTDDWDVGGDLVGSIDNTDIVENGYNEISIDTDCINKEGETQFKLGWKGDIADDYEPSDPSVYGNKVVVGGGYVTFPSKEAANSPTLVVTAS